MTNILSLCKILILIKSKWRAYRDSLLFLQLFCKPKTITKYKIKTKTQQYEGTYLVLLFQVRPSPSCLFLTAWRSWLCSLGGLWFRFNDVTQCSQTWKSKKRVFVSPTLCLSLQWGWGFLPIFLILGSFQSSTPRNSVAWSSLGKQRSVASLFIWLKMFPNGNIWDPLHPIYFYF